MEGSKKVLDQGVNQGDKRKLYLRIMVSVMVFLTIFAYVLTELKDGLVPGPIIIGAIVVGNSPDSGQVITEIIRKIIINPRNWSNHS